jgi:hypothetical protein
MPIDKSKFRQVGIPILTYRSIKKTSAEIDKTMGQLLTDAWNKWSELNSGKEGACKMMLQYDKLQKYEIELPAQSPVGYSPIRSLVVLNKEVYHE